MYFEWKDYIPEKMGYVENWLDNSAIHFTGMDEGWEDFYRYWADVEYSIPGENYWCKVVFENDIPFAVVAFAVEDNNFTIMEVLVAPEVRGKGKGTALLKELIKNSVQICGKNIIKANAVIYPDNPASQKTFEKAGFVFDYENEDGDTWYYIFDLK